MHFRQNSSFSFLLPFKSAAKPLTRSTLIKAMVSNTDVARFVANLLPTAVKCMPSLPYSSLLLTATVDSHSHRTLLAFHAATIHDYISNVPTLDDSILAFILPSLLAPLHSSQKDSNVVVSFLIAVSLQPVHPFLPSVGQLCSPVCSLPKSEPETCCRICYHQHHRRTSAWCSWFRKRFCLYDPFRQNRRGNLFVANGCSRISPQCMPIVHEDVVCHFCVILRMSLTSIIRVGVSPTK